VTHSQNDAPLDIAGRVFDDSPLSTFFIADLDRIESRAAMSQLSPAQRAFKDVVFWVDAGVRDAAEARSWLCSPRRCASRPWQ